MFEKFFYKVHALNIHLWFDLFKSKYVTSFFIKMTTKQNDRKDSWAHFVAGGVSGKLTAQFFLNNFQRSLFKNRYSTTLPPHNLIPGLLRQFLFLLYHS